jgi:hypothetical protein
MLIVLFPLIGGALIAGSGWQAPRDSGRAAGAQAAGRGGDDLLRRLGQVRRGLERQPAGVEQRESLLRVGTLEADHDRHRDADLAHRGDDPLGDQVAAHDATEDVDQHRAHLVVGQDDLERLGDARRGGATTDVEEVGRCAAVQLDQVHGRHRKAGAVHHAADRAVERDVVEIVLRRGRLAGVLLAGIAHRLQVGVPVQRVVVEVDLPVERHQVAVAGHDQRVDLDQAGVLLMEQPGQAEQQPLERLDLVRRETEREADPTGLVRLDAGRRVDQRRDDLLRRLRPRPPRCSCRPRARP